MGKGEDEDGEGNGNLTWPPVPENAMASVLAVKCLGRGTASIWGADRCEIRPVVAGF
jgi:hypothetical protein